MGIPVCPLDPAHGPLLQWTGDKPLHCPHVDHDGRPAGHPKGPLPRSAAFFTFTELAVKK